MPRFATLKDAVLGFFQMMGDVVCFGLGEDQVCGLQIPVSSTAADAGIGRRRMARVGRHN